MSAIASTIDNLVAALGASDALSDVQIIDGPTVQDLQFKTIEVGIRTEEIDPVEGTIEGAGLGSELEVFDLSNQITVFSGDASVKEVRDQAFTILASVRAVLNADPTLNGAVDRARVSSVVYMIEPSENGLTAGVLFGLRVEALSYLS